MWFYADVSTTCGECEEAADLSQFKTQGNHTTTTTYYVTSTTDIQFGDFMTDQESWSGLHRLLCNSNPIHQSVSMTN